MITILGSGIAGTALAGGLSRSGRPVTVYEQQHGGGGGAFLILDGRGHSGLLELGVPEAELHAASYPLTELQYTPDDGVTRRRPSEGHRFWLRSDLIEVLKRFARDAGAEIGYGSPVTEVTVDAAHGHTTFRVGDRSVTTEDLVIGADGIDSAARAGSEPGRVTEYAGDVVLYGMTATPVECPTDPFVLHFHAESGSGTRPAATFGHIWRPGAAAALWFLRVTRAPLPVAETGSSRSTGGPRKCSRRRPPRSGN
ncbi:FAD-dependent oxidoreductase [Nocardia sp. NBC_00416]|uniref:FAD-dependent oxidoreductase n=1 Tax=Nocardia sp. NBC_00416 TaxID=2975991 RepID=UPI002E1CEA19